MNEVFTQSKKLKIFIKETRITKLILLPLSTFVLFVVVSIIRFLTTHTNKQPWKCSKIRKQTLNIKKKNVTINVVLAITTKSQVFEADAFKEKEMK